MFLTRISDLKIADNGVEDTQRLCWLGGNPMELWLWSPVGGLVGTVLMDISASLADFLIGDPDSLTEQILHQREVTGAGVVAIRLELGDVDLDEVTENLELFSREVLPVLKKA